ncbi:uncharacterized protein LOC118935479 isoform X2 [Manis pentadactyla]|uniref:uncharacterized protein LOC118935479 isoform X2 n=1 Tax=Manis pentadactyla TaxID=143292 RepID=UPI00255C64CC|nr:uncharacterized protein LOC118935479 isoform X2 [Manis pentadactyla]
MLCTNTGKTHQEQRSREEDYHVPVFEMRKQPEEAARTRAWLRLPSWEEAKAQSPTLAFLPPLASRALGLRGGQSPQWQQHLGLPGTEQMLNRDHHPMLTSGASHLYTENFGEMKSYGEKVHRDIHVSLHAISLLLETRWLGVGYAAVLPGPPCAASPLQALRISSCHSGMVSSVCLFMSYSHELFSVLKRQVSRKLPSILAPVRIWLGPSWDFLPAPSPQQATSPRQFFPARLITSGGTCTQTFYPFGCRNQSASPQKFSLRASTLQG